MNIETYGAYTRTHAFRTRISCFQLYGALVIFHRAGIAQCAQWAMLIQQLVGYTLHNNKKVFLCIYNLREKCFQKPIFPETNSIQCGWHLTSICRVYISQRPMLYALNWKLVVYCKLSGWTSTLDVFFGQIPSVLVWLGEICDCFYTLIFYLIVRFYLLLTFAKRNCLSFHFVK